MSEIYRRSIIDMSEHQIESLSRLAKTYVKSNFNTGRNSLSYETAFMTMLKGVELGFSPMAAIELINVIFNKPTISPAGMIALANQTGELEDIQIEPGDGQCTVTMKRKGRTPHSETFTMQDADKMGITKNSNWKSQPDTMLKWRAVSACARVVFPDAIQGMYTPEEIAPGSEVDEEGNLIEAPDEVTPGNNEGNQPTRSPRPTKRDSRRIEHWAKNDAKRKQFLDLAVKQLELNSYGEAWEYLASHFTPGTELEGVSDITADFETAMARIREMGAHKALDDAADKSPQGEIEAGTTEVWAVDTISTHKKDNNTFCKLWKQGTQETVTLFTRQPLRDAGYDVEPWGTVGEYALDPLAQVTVTMGDNGYWSVDSVKKGDEPGDEIPFE